jgi:hypothetical protein
LQTEKNIFANLDISRGNNNHYTLTNQIVRDPACNGLDGEQMMNTMQKKHSANPR